MKPLIIVGGGLAGLAAAVRCASPDRKLILLEQKPFPGGRAWSYTDEATGDSVDNGQHLLIAGYERTMEFLSRIGARDLVEVQLKPSLFFHHPQKGFRSFSLPSLPAPLNLAAGIMTTGLLGPSDRVRLLRAGIALRRETEEEWKGQTIADWLDDHGQSDEARRCFWEPLAVSIMNETIAHGSAAVFLTALRIAFLGSRHAAALVFPRVGLSDLFATPALTYLEQKGAVVRCSAPVEELRIEQGAFAGVRLRGGESIDGSACLLAVPPPAVSSLLPEVLSQQRGADSDLSSSPIVSVQLWFPSDIMTHPFCGIIGRTVQWVFNRRRLAHSDRADGYVSAVVSAAYDLVAKSNDEIVRIVVEDLRSVYGESVPEPLQSVVIREKKATISLTPGVEAMRPGASTHIPNLFLAGDWTSTGYPATIEGAIVSGERGADMMMASSIGAR